MKLQRYRLLGVPMKSDNGQWVRVEDVMNYVNKQNDHALKVLKLVEEKYNAVIIQMPFDIMRRLMQEMNIDESKIRQAEEALKEKLHGGKLH